MCVNQSDLKFESVPCLCLHCDHLTSSFQKKKALHSVRTAACDPVILVVAEVGGCPLRKKKVPITGGL